MDSIRLLSGCEVQEPHDRLLKFCEAEHAYYDAIPSGDPNRIEPMDVLVTVAMNSFVNSAGAVHRVHRGMGQACNPLLAQIPEAADLLSYDESLSELRALLDAAIQVKGVLIAVATKVLHRKRRFLIPMLDRVVVGHYLRSPDQQVLKSQIAYKGPGTAAAAIEVLRAFREDLRAARAEIEILCEALGAVGFRLAPVRVLELLIWTEMEPNGTYRNDQATTR